MIYGKLNRAIKKLGNLALLAAHMNKASGVLSFFEHAGYPETIE